MSDLIPDPTKQDNRPAVYENDDGDIIYRASAVGYCTKMLIAIRQGYKTKPVPESIRAKMDESSSLEDEAIDKFIADHHMNITELERQVAPIKLKIRDGVFVRGKPDTKIGLVDGRKGIIEVKNLGDSLYKANTVSIQHKYLAQSTVYMVGYDFVVMVLRNKETGEMYYKWFDTTPMDFGRIYRKILFIEEQAETMELPEKCDPVQYPCPVYYLHEKEPIEPWEDVSLQQDFEELARAYEEARLREKDAKAQKLALQKQLIAFRTRHPEIISEDGTVESSRAKFSKARGSRTSVDQQKLTHFLAQHDATVAEFETENTYDMWRVTWRG